MASTGQYDNHKRDMSMKIPFEEVLMVEIKFDIVLNVNVLIVCICNH